MQTGDMVLETHYYPALRPKVFKPLPAIMRQLFLLVLAMKREISCFTFLLLHFGQVTLPFSCSLKLCINENSFLQALQRYSYVGMLSPPLQDYRYCSF